MYSTIIVDDEDYAIETLATYVNKTPFLSLSGKYSNPLDSLKILSGFNPPHIAFLDIDMPELSGLSLASMVKPGTVVVFTSAHEQYALKAFGLKAAGYLLKPFSFEDFLITVKNVCERIGDPELMSNKKPIFFNGSAKGKYVKLFVEDIIYIEAMANYIKIFTVNREKPETIYVILKEIESELSGKTFIRVHRSFLINTSYLERIEGNRLLMKGGTVINLGNTYKNEFLAFVHEHQLKSKQYTNPK